MSKIVLFDIDYTLFNTTAYKKNVAEKLAEKVASLDFEKVQDAVDEVYSDVRSFGSFDPHLFADLFIKKFPNTVSREEVEEVWWQKDVLLSAMYPEAIGVLQSLQRKEGLTLGIFSSGKTEFQLAKISHIEDFFHKDHIHIASFKEETLPELVKEYTNHHVILVDDYIEILKSAKEVKKDLFAIWMKRGRFAEKAIMPSNFEPDATIVSLEELPDLVDNN